MASVSGQGMRGAPCALRRVASEWVLTDDDQTATVTSITAEHTSTRKHPWPTPNDVHGLVHLRREHLWPTPNDCPWPSAFEKREHPWPTPNDIHGLVHLRREHPWPTPNDVHALDAPTVLTGCICVADPSPFATPHVGPSRSCHTTCST